MSLTDDLEKGVEAVVAAILAVVGKSIASSDPIATAKFEAQLEAHRLLVEHAADLILAAKAKIAQEAAKV